MQGPNTEVQREFLRLLLALGLCGLSALVVKKLQISDKAPQLKLQSHFSICFCVVRTSGSTRSRGFEFQD